MAHDTFATATWLVRHARSRVSLTDHRVRLTGFRVPVTTECDSSAGRPCSIATGVVPLPRRCVRGATCCVALQTGRVSRAGARVTLTTSRVWVTTPRV